MTSSVVLTTADCSYPPVPFFLKIINRVLSNPPAMQEPSGDMGGAEIEKAGSMPERQDASPVLQA